MNLFVYWIKDEQERTIDWNTTWWTTRRYIWNIQRLVQNKPILLF